MLIEQLHLIARRNRDIIEIIDEETGALQMCYPAQHYTNEEALAEFEAKYL
ncbi:hypothetical protein ACOMICROBIO_FLGHMIGD_03941 [Vibrio sp. B1FLJ16]|uniref:hypothetical protein n=1 Tax=Vibrio sp. B1FLJ16 TaxID=2751178 RepID=UPI0015F4E367|nr:hypothetical protein [Vibrio sp. B1FLJ16]CAD7819512.1 hypothetical protein ACOMICROBIO_FLGHMIGD_03941 [Vibrio sp. B1FLJ16]CAE6939143.1 hypothetical protein ACOMICROBIO_FLGHMIGD_03941 [Vibrio sp. B1FLJ16]